MRETKTNALVVALRELKMFGMAHAVGELAEQGAPAFEAAQPLLAQLLKAETAEREVRAVAAIEALRTRPLLVMHGSDDESVPVFDARVLADEHGDADLRIIEGGGHQLRHDPRAIAVLLGWLDRQRTLTASERTG